MSKNVVIAEQEKNNEHCPEDINDKFSESTVDDASLYWEGPSVLPHRRSSCSAPRRDSTEPRPRGCSVLGEPPQALPSF